MMGKGRENGYPASAYILIRSSDPDRATSELRKLTGVESVIGTAGDLDLIARIGAENRDNMFSTIVKQVHGVPGVKSTETLPTFVQF
jgi:DNA-binding Lrp family transcriptional regulator